MNVKQYWRVQVLRALIEVCDLIQYDLGADYMSPTGRASPILGEISRAI